MSLFTGLCALFYYVPHVRQMFRKTFADKVLLVSFARLLAIHEMNDDWAVTYC